MKKEKIRLTIIFIVINFFKVANFSKIILKKHMKRAWESDKLRIKKQDSNLPNTCPPNTPLWE